MKQTQLEQLQELSKKANRRLNLSCAIVAISIFLIIGLTGGFEHDSIKLIPYIIGVALCLTALYFSGSACNKYLDISKAIKVATTQLKRHYYHEEQHALQEAQHAAAAEAFLQLQADMNA